MPDGSLGLSPEVRRRGPRALEEGVRPWGQHSAFLEGGSNRLSAVNMASTNNKDSFWKLNCFYVEIMYFVDPLGYIPRRPREAHQRSIPPLL